MQVWKRRVAFVLAVGTGTLGLTLSSAGAQTPPDFPTFPTFPTFPDFPTIPSTSPPPTMPPSTSPTTAPPPTMPPTTFPTIPPPPTMPPSTVPPTTSPPPTMPPTSSPPTSVPTVDDAIRDLLERLEDLAEDSPFEEVRQIVDDIVADFLD